MFDKSSMITRIPTQHELNIIKQKNKERFNSLAALGLAGGIVLGGAGVLCLYFNPELDAKTVTFLITSGISLICGVTFKIKSSLIKIEKPIVMQYRKTYKK